ncbi:MAG: helix-turn-helix domain-containing protein [Lachnospiraceae bacterium]|nr:helix-turn-helix domain-containing protein [Lachnospiraceae bacterium]
MQIGEVIRKYRKSKNMTQEEMANRLGVSAPAVNKWENGNSMPDITLLSPIARLLDITPDTLLSFHEELTREEINGLINEANDKLKKEPYEQVFLWAKKILEQYPNCEWLVWQMALVLDAWRITKGVPEAESYDDYLCGCYERILDSREEELKKYAADSLLGFYIRKEQWEKAEELLAYFAPEDPERKRKQAFIYSKTDRKQEAYKAYEQILFSGYQMSSMVLYNLFWLAMEEEDKAKARYLVEKQSQMAKVFEMGRYNEICVRLELAAAEKEIDETIEIMRQLLESADTISKWQTSPLYEHMEFKALSDDFKESLKKTMRDNFRDEEAYGFLKGDKRYQELVE